MQLGRKMKSLAEFLEENRKELTFLYENGNPTAVKGIYHSE